MAIEKLKFKIEIYSAYFKNPPIVEIKIGMKNVLDQGIPETHITASFRYAGIFPF